MATAGNIYVAELHIPTDVHTRPQFREQLPQPGIFGVSRGYWNILFEPDKFGTPRATGILLTIEFVASNQTEAEDKALDLAATIGELVALFGGSPKRPPRIRRIARIGAGQGTFEHHQYYYVEDADRLRQVEIEPYKLSRLLQSHSMLNEVDSQRVVLATRWYVISVSTSDPVDSYLATWIGLESIGAKLNEIYHKSGPKAPCSICNNKAGEKRDKGKAGITHIIKMTAPEILTSRSVNDLEKIRHQVAHAIVPVSKLREETTALLKDMQVSLAKGILNILGNATTPPISYSVFLPRETEVRPDARASLYSAVELMHHKPYFGEWISAERTFLNEQSRCEPNGAYVWGAGVSIGWRITMVEEGNKPSDEYVNFHREGARLTNIDENNERNVPEVHWRPYNEPASWQRIREAAEQTCQS